MSERSILKHMKQRILSGLAVLTTAAVLLSACRVLGPTPEPTPTPVPAPEQAWERIQERGKMVVGTSADYPPFAYYNRLYRMDGFDPALIQAIGQKLGVQVEIRDYAFDGLFNALQLGEIDLAIAAITVTPEREAVVDYSNAYYVGSDAALADAESPYNALDDIQEISDLRIGVQSGSVYEQALEKRLVETGQMQAVNLFRYPDIGEAVKDLQRARLDLVVMDLLPAQEFVQQSATTPQDGVKLVAQGLHQQQYAMAIPQGALSLQRVVNQALADLVQDGTYGRLVKQHLLLDQEDLLPLPPSPEVPPTPAPPETGGTPACIDGMSYVADVTYDDQNMTAPPKLSPGQPFVKTWRIRNSGSCTWDSSYSLAYAHGNTPASGMSGAPAAIVGQVAPGATYDISVNLVAPGAPGVYQGFWQMRNGQGVAFGQTIYVGIEVVAAPTATPAPTQTPVAGIQFSVDRDHIKAGECVTFSWNVENVQAVYFYAEGEDWEDNGVVGHGSSVECPPQTTTYYLRVVKRDGSVEVREITVTVQPAAGAPLISLFVVTPNQIVAGQCVNIAWVVEGQVEWVTIGRGGAPLWDGAPFSGNMSDCPPGVGSVVYGLRATGPGGTSERQASVNVQSPVQPTNTPAPLSTDTPVPLPTDTPVPLPTDTPVPLPTDTPTPQVTPL